MDFDSVCKHLRLRVEPDVADACRFLQERGYVFCVDFGTENAHRKAGEVIFGYGEPPYVGIPRVRASVRRCYSRSLGWH